MNKKISSEKKFNILINIRFNNDCGNNLNKKIFFTTKKCLINKKKFLTLLRFTSKTMFRCGTTHSSLQLFWRFN